MASFSEFFWKRLWLNPIWNWNVLLSFAIWATHFGREEVQKRRQEPEWDVLGLSSRSYLLSWQLGVHHTGLVSRAVINSLTETEIETEIIDFQLTETEIIFKTETELKLKLILILKLKYTSYYIRQIVDIYTYIALESSYAPYVLKLYSVEVNSNPRTRL